MLIGRIERVPVHFLSNLDGIASFVSTLRIIGTLLQTQRLTTCRSRKIQSKMYSEV